MAEIPVNFLLEKLHAFLVNEAQLLRGIRPEIERIMEKLEIMKAFLKDADRKKDSREVIKTWVNQVRRAAYDLEDVIDEFLLRHGTRSRESDGILNSLRTLLSTMKQLSAKRHLANRIQEIKSRITEMEESRRSYDIDRIEEDKSLDTTIRRLRDRGEANFMGEPEVVGIEKDVELLEQKLMGTVAGNDPYFVSVVGMGGLGKTTLVRKVYKHVETRFDRSAWVSVSQSFNPKDLLKDILKEFGYESPPGEMNEEDMREELKDFLEGKRFILVLDDVWVTRVWDYIKFALPANYCGSKIMITTRLREVALALGTNEHENFVHDLKPLPGDVAKALLCGKAFGGRSMPCKFENVCKMMLRKCSGLPLAIVVLGGILRNKTRVEEWEKVLNEDLGRLRDDAPEGSIGSILKLSYDELPFHLKPCFLYCCLFPEDHLIKRNKLVRLWVAEGFIKGSDGKTSMEEIGEDYMMQLIDRSMLQIEDTSIDRSRVKSCKIHDLMRDLAISISQEEEFLFDKQNENVIKKGRRMCVVGHNEENCEISRRSLDNRHMRSLLFFDVGSMKRRDLISSLGGFRLLRVLDLEDVIIDKLPEQITHLLHLRYLSLNNSLVSNLPRSIGRLLNLETLDIRWTNIFKLPDGIVRLTNLRHLCMSCTIVPRGIGDLRCLQTLTVVDGSMKGIGGEIGKLKELRRLGITNLENEEAAEEVCASIRSMTRLFNLTILPSLGSPATCHKLLEHPPSNLRILNLGGLSNWPVTLGSLDNLISLNLSDGRLTDDPFPSLSLLLS